MNDDFFEFGWSAVLSNSHMAISVVVMMIPSSRIRAMAILMVKFLT